MQCCLHCFVEKALFTRIITETRALLYDSCEVCVEKLYAEFVCQSLLYAEFVCQSLQLLPGSMYGNTMMV